MGEERVMLFEKPLLETERLLELGESAEGIRISGMAENMELM